MGRLARRSRGRRRESRGGEGGGVKLEELGTSKQWAAGADPDRLREGIARCLYGNKYSQLEGSVAAAAAAGLGAEDPYVAVARSVLSLHARRRETRNLCSSQHAASIPVLRDIAQGVAEEDPSGVCPVLQKPSRFVRIRKPGEVRQADSFASALTMVDHLSQDTKATAAILAGDAEGLQSLLKESDESGNRHTAQRVQLVLKKMTAPYNWHTRFQQWEREKRMMDCQASLQRIEQLKRLEENREREQEAFHKAWMFQKHILTVSKEDAIQEYKKAISEMAGQRRQMDAEVRRSLQGLERCWIDNFSTKKPWTPSLTGPQALQHFCKRMTCKRCNPKDWKWAEEAPMENIAEHQFFMGIMHKTDKMLKTRICENPVAHMCGHCSESDEHCHREKE
uniref:Uncharacterized protein n=1 Tax=Tetraselmis sp. GSL018 TaxID=582737 RepID=A0A061QX44_9CHLO|eukprot:CAMPEP_0177613548 /NCGR_PEP_ID=MMETSP0419_2-20121207/22063_1 /TAXON_ID=582737 /ORGANISM="Tetraselmis sp., Strain GSL018" /LENGTH=393 /DNA_ID=CAMNT_0019110311 /DNA_START=647 /DNA_END=1828 /DNA_ORIENTATION=+